MARRLLLRNLFRFGLILVASATFHVSIAATLSGPVDIVYDGDTFEIHGQRIRLKGIDAPEIAQTCYDDRQRSYACGETATSYLKQLVANKRIRCQGNEKDKYGRLISRCYVGNRELNRAMVKAGWAMAYRRYDGSYVTSEDAARVEKRGLWQGRFTEPEAFRSASWEKIPEAAREKGKECLIKGNINTRGTRIYHTPWGSTHYQKVRVSANKGERWFCSEAEALAAGWRAPYR